MSLPPIALTGFLRSGKDEVAAYLVRTHNYTRFAFGDELKRYYHELFGGDPSEKPREGYQWFGQAIRSREPDIWVRKCFKRIAWDEDFKVPVISDLRQQNEYDRCRSEGYVIIRVTAPEEIRLARARQAGDTFNVGDLSHETESRIDSFAVDYEVENSGSIIELLTQVDAIITDIKRRGTQ